MTARPDRNAIRGTVYEFAPYPILGVLIILWLVFT